MSKFLENTWYCIGWAEELDHGPIGQTIIEKPVVVFRTDDGELVALGGACPHRFAPLAQGKVCGNTIVCPYHGLVFDTSGQCIRNPHGPGGEGHIPPRAKVAKYAAIEKFGAIWVWLGDPEQADDSYLNFFDWTSSPDYGGFKGYLKVNANYQLVIDNLLDLTHGPYLHPNTLAGDQLGEKNDEIVPEIEFRTDPDHTIHSNYLFRSIPPGPLIAPIWGDRLSDLYSEMRWRPASILELDIIATPVGADKTNGIHQPSYHFISPKNELETHYFYASGRNMMIDDEEIQEHMHKTARTAFAEEDAPMIRSCQEMMGTPNLMSLNPAILSSDVSAVQARRLLSKLIKQEQFAKAESST